MTEHERCMLIGRNMRMGKVPLRTEPTKAEMREMLAEAVRNTASMQVEQEVQQ